MTNDLISKAALIGALQSSIYVDHKYGNWIYEDALLKLINSAPVVSQQLAEQSLASEPVVKVRVTNKGYAMTLATYVAYALPEGDHWLYTTPPSVNVLVEALTKIAFMGTDNALGTDREYFMQRQLGHCIGIASETLATYSKPITAQEG